jgi:hypothetical protein
MGPAGRTPRAYSSSRRESGPELLPDDLFELLPGFYRFRRRFQLFGDQFVEIVDGQDPLSVAAAD